MNEEIMYALQQIKPQCVMFLRTQGFRDEAVDCFTDFMELSGAGEEVWITFRTNEHQLNTQRILRVFGMFLEAVSYFVYQRTTEV